VFFFSIIKIKGLIEMSKLPLKSMLAVAMTTATLLPLSSAACGSDPYLLGTICAFAFTFCPRGYLPTAGQTLPIAQNQALFALLGTTYGGNGQTTFALPDLRGRSVIGSGQGAGLSPISIGQVGGAEQITLTPNQMPAHTHTVTTSVTVNTAIKAVSGAGNTTNPTGNVWAASSSRDNVYSNTAPNATMASAAVATTASGNTTIAQAGSSQPFSNRSPYLGVTYCIATIGLFPPRD
jgi:microcystin-dependent protein